MIGRSLLHYQIQDKLGQGGMGEVYRARDTRLNRFVAIKMLKLDAGSGDERQKLFLHEAQAASSLNHPNIVTIHEIGSSNGLDFIVMEFVEGRPLSQVIGRRGIPFREAVRYAVQIADALSKAHMAGIVHRDLKPANVMITGEGKVKLLDFGIAKRIEPAQEGDAAQTGDLDLGELSSGGRVVGTTAYMSPEQLVGGKIDARSDIFSFGAVFYEMLSGKRAFESGSTAATATAILRDQPQLDSASVRRFTPDLARILDRSLRKDPERRYQHIDDLKVELEDLLEKREPAEEAAEQGRRLPPRRRWWRGVALAGLESWSESRWDGCCGKTWDIRVALALA